MLAVVAKSGKTYGATPVQKSARHLTTGAVSFILLALECKVLKEVARAKPK